MKNADLSEWVALLGQAASLLAKEFEPERLYTKEEVQRMQADAWDVGITTALFGNPDTAKNPYREFE